MSLSNLKSRPLVPFSNDRPCGLEVNLLLNNGRFRHNNYVDKLSKYYLLI